MVQPPQLDIFSPGLWRSGGQQYRNPEAKECQAGHGLLWKGAGRLWVLGRGVSRSQGWRRQGEGWAQGLSTTVLPKAQLETQWVSLPIRIETHWRQDTAQPLFHWLASRTSCPLPSWYSATGQNSTELCTLALGLLLCELGSLVLPPHVYCDYGPTTEVHSCNFCSKWVIVSSSTTRNLSPGWCLNLKLYGVLRTRYYWK